MKIIIKQDNTTVAEAFADFFFTWLNDQDNDQVAVALSGGSTPKALFQHWAEKYREKIDWRRIHFFWGDERCVPPGDPESNFGMTKRLLFDQIAIPENNIHRVRGEEPPIEEAERYGEEVKASMPVHQGIPIFDMIILGMGADGHTASIFPHQMELLTNPNICAMATHPESGQKRITLTGSVLNAARQVVFLVTGKIKAPIVHQIKEKTGNYKQYPAAHILSETEEIIWFVDESAAS